MMTLIGDIEYNVGHAITNTIGNDMLLGLLAMLVFAGACMMLRLSLEASVVVLVPAVLTIFLFAGIGQNVAILGGLVAAVVLYLAYTKLFNR